MSENGRKAARCRLITAPKRKKLQTLSRNELDYWSTLILYTVEVVPPALMQSTAVDSGVAQPPIVNTGWSNKKLANTR